MIAWGIGFLALTAVIALNPEPFVGFGYPGVFFFNMLSGPGMFLLPSLSTRMNVLGLAMASAGGMAVNDSVGWLAGRSGEELLPTSEKVKKIQNSIQKFGPWALLFWSLIPFPYDLIGLIAGYLRIPYPKYILPTFLGKFIRFLLISSGVLAFWSNDKI